jgi:hypothetical protein
MAELFDLTCRVERDEDQDRAILIKTEDGKKIWLPRSQIEIEYKDQRKYFAVVTMPEWLALEKELV